MQPKTLAEPSDVGALRGPVHWDAWGGGDGYSPTIGVRALATLDFGRAAAKYGLE